MTERGETVQPSGCRVPRILIMGVGGSGVIAVSEMKQKFPAIGAVFVDTDSTLLSGLDNPDCIIDIGRSITRGFSAGGDVELGRQSLEKDSSGVRQRLRNVDLLIVIAGLGGGTGSGAVPVVTRIAREAGILTLAMLSTPFAFEGKKIARVAEESLKRIRTHADAIIRVPNERLIDKAETDLPIDQAFGRGRKLMQDGVLALWNLLAGKGVCGLDFACIHTMLRNCDGFCHLAVAEGAGPTRAAQAASAILKHPLLGNGKLFAGSAGAIVGITGGSNLGFGEVESIVGQIEKSMPGEGLWFNFGIAVEPSLGDRISVVVLLAEQWKEPLVDGAGRQMGFRFNPRPAGGQGELMLENIGKGQFSHLDPTILNNQDLDVPTYVRREIKLPR